MSGDNLAPKKKLKSITPRGDCLETYPCQHPDTLLVYEDGTTEVVYMGGGTAIELSREHGIPVPIHWQDVSEWWDETKNK